MYTIQKAAAMLGIPEKRVRGWMEQCGIEGKMIKTDRRRLYITHNDMNILIDHLDQKIAKSANKKGKQKGDNTEGIVKEEDKHSQENAEEGFYSLDGAASFLGVSTYTVRNWIKQHNVATKLLITDRKRLYIARDDILLLADLHGRKSVKKGHADLTIQREDDNAQGDGKNELYSLEEVAACLNASQGSVKRWIRQHNIEREMRTTDRRRLYIAYNDVLLLADLHKRKVGSNLSPVNIVEDLKEMRSKLEKLASEVEDIKHDLRLYVKRSIYIG